MIAAVELSNFKNVRHMRVELGRLTVFVGPNGSGKTSVLQALDLAVRAVRPRLIVRRDGGEVTRVFESRPASAFRGNSHCDWLYARGGVGDLAIQCQTTGGGGFAVTASPPDGWPPQSAEQLGRQQWTFRAAVTSGTDGERAGPPPGVVSFLRLNAGVIAEPSYSRLTIPRMGTDGEGLASVLAFMALSDPEGFERLTEELRRVVPQVRRIRFTRDVVEQAEREIVRFGAESVTRNLTREVQGDAILFDYENGDNVSARTASEGTLLLLGLLTTLLGPRRPRLLLLDDFEQGLHPNAQRELLHVLRRLMARLPDLQVVSTAHSPYLLDGLGPDEVRMTATGADGYTVCGKLTDHPDFTRWQAEMAPGELWSLFGEKWLGKRDASHE